MFSMPPKCVRNMTIYCAAPHLYTTLNFLPSINLQTCSNLGSMYESVRRIAMHLENSLTQLLLADFICRHSVSATFRRVPRHSKTPWPACAIVLSPDGIVLKIVASWLLFWGWTSTRHHSWLWWTSV
jgi:hypothetical protein